MTRNFFEIIEEFPRLLEKLKESESLSKNQLKSIPEQGIYVFYERNIPLYVGRSGRKGRFKTRILEHSRQSSGHGTATFAFILAKDEAKEKGVNVDISRTNLEKEPKFAEVYREAKERVSKMQLKIIEINDPIEQTLFEVYAALELNTPYNKWETH
jgi:hypothetical protein